MGVVATILGWYSYRELVQWELVGSAAGSCALSAPLWARWSMTLFGIVLGVSCAVFVVSLVTNTPDHTL